MEGKFKGLDLLQGERLATYANENIYISQSEFGRGVFGKGGRGTLIMISQAVS